MERTEAFDKILKFLFDNQKSYCDMIGNGPNIGIHDRTLLYSICDELVERGWARPNKNNYMIAITYEGKQIYEKYSGSYSSFLHSEKVAQKKAQRSKTTPDVIKIGIAIIFGLSTAILGWLNYIDNKKIASLELDLSHANNKIDSLKSKVLELKQSSTDTLKIN